MGYSEAKRIAQAHAVKTGNFMRLKEDAFGWGSRMVSVRPSLHFGPDADGELISPLACVWSSVR